MAEISFRAVFSTIERHANWLRDPLTGDRADFTGKTLARVASCYAADLRHAIFRGANLTGVDFSSARLNGADFRGALLLECNFDGADLTEADLTGAYLCNARMSRAKLTGAKLSVLSHPSVGDTELLTAEPYPPLVEDILCCIDSGRGRLDMHAWHTPEMSSCGTVHCLAGWAVTVHAVGRRLEHLLGTSAAAALIFQACLGEVPDYYSTRKVALSWLRKQKDK